MCPCTEPLASLVHTRIMQFDVTGLPGCFLPWPVPPYPAPLCPALPCLPLDSSCPTLHCLIIEDGTLLWLQAQKPVLVTAPFGKLDPLMDHAHLTVFPIPSGLLQPAAEPHTVSDRSGLDTTHYGQSYCSNLYKGDAAAVLAATQRCCSLSCLLASQLVVCHSAYSVTRVWLVSILLDYWQNLVATLARVVVVSAYNVREVEIVCT